MSSHFLCIEPEAHCESLLTTDEHRRDPLHCLQTILDLSFCECREFQRRLTLAVHAHPNHRLGVRFLLRHDWLLDCLRQLAAHSRHAVTNILRRLIDIASEIELNRDAADLLTIEFD